VYLIFSAVGSFLLAAYGLHYAWSLKHYKGHHWGQGQDGGEDRHRHVHWFIKHVLPHKIAVSAFLTILASVLLFAGARWGYRTAKQPEAHQAFWRLRRVKVVVIVASLLLIIKGHHDHKAVNQFEWAVRKDHRRHHNGTGNGTEPQDSFRHLFSMEETWTTMVDSVTQNVDGLKNFWKQDEIQEDN